MEPMQVRNVSPWDYTTTAAMWVVEDGVKRTVGEIRRGQTVWVSHDDGASMLLQPANYAPADDTAERALLDLLVLDGQGKQAPAKKAK